MTNGNLATRQVAEALPLVEHQMVQAFDHEDTADGSGKKDQDHWIIPNEFMLQKKDNDQGNSKSYFGRKFHGGGSAPKRRTKAEMAERGRKMEKITTRIGRKMYRSNTRTAMMIMAGGPYI
ncbi:MAG: hypothetical protein LBD68_09800, partial [Zoogloeaceae bacterium]|nr:hypothetical protein [Zoogloeaceae bacterium]